MKDRNTLKNYFKKGNIPSEANFEHLIDSGINKIDDGFSKNHDDGLMISSIGGTNNLLSFYESIADDKPQWMVKINKDGELNDDKNNLQFKHPESQSPVLTFNKVGKTGINEEKPKSELDVNGWVLSTGRAGNYAKESTIPADGSWHQLTPGLNHCQAFEVVARTGIKNTGKHAILHAIAVSAYGNSRSSIRKTRGHFNFWKPVKLQLRWTGTTYSYKLEMRCKQNLGSGVEVKYYITQLWSDEVLGLEKQFMNVDESGKK